MSLLEVRDLSLSVHGASILREVDLDVASGEVVGLVGESGSGKSMTALALMGLPPRGASSSGRIVLAGEEFLKKSETEMCDVRGRLISMVFQEPMTALNPLQPIGAQVAETIKVHRRGGRMEAARAARECLDRVGLPAEQFSLERYPHELSGGQRQRVVIAMAIALRPKLLIADEPTTALDVTTQAQILKLLRKLVDEDNMGCLLITHDLAVIADTAERVAIMQNGEVVETGRTTTVLKRPCHPYTQALLAATKHRPNRVNIGSTVPLLRVERLSRTYLSDRPGLLARRTEFESVRDVSFTLGHGESLGLVGESGCGKSTLGRAILGLDTIQAGSVYLDGQNLSAGWTVDRELRAKMQAVFQDPFGSFNPRHKVARLVSEPFHLLDNPPKGSKRAEAIATALLDVGMQPQDAVKFIHEFSGGQRQRIALARALIIRPKLVILDEAVSALDVQVRARILDLLVELSGRYGLSYLFISHDLSVVRNVTDRVMVMKAGEIVEVGPTETVFETPRHAYTKALLAAVPSFELSA